MSSGGPPLELVAISPITIPRLHSGSRLEKEPPYNAAMSTFYTEGQRKMQRQFDSERIADKIVEKLSQTQLDEYDKGFIESQIMFFLATVDENGRPNCSFKGGPRGFVQVLDPCTLAFPDYNGNGMFLSMGNVQSSHHVGLLFIDFEKQERFRVNGEASIHPNDPLLGHYFGAKQVVRVRVREAFPNCPRYIPKMRIEEMSRFIPKDGIKPPIPEWKTRDWACDALPADDPTRD